MIDFLYSIDKSIFMFFNSGVANRFFDIIMPYITETDHWRIPFIVAWAALMIFGGSKGRTAGIFMILLVAISDQISSALLKPLIHRLRPCFVPELEGICRLLIDQPNSPSFPSSHAVNNTAVAMFFLFKYRRLSIPLGLLLLFALLSTYSRVYVGVHFPSDLIGGALLGTLLAYSVLKLEKGLSIVMKPIWPRITGKFRGKDNEEAGK